MNYQFITAFTSSLMITWVMLWLLSQSKFLKNQNRIKRWICVRAGKTSDALLLAGIPVVLSWCALTWMNSQFIDNQTFISSSLYITCVLMICAYGYLDDVLELRSLVKLSIQIMTILTFSLLVSPHIAGVSSNWSMLFVFAIGLASMNGANLLDGIDTQMTKLSIVILLAYAYINHSFGAIPVRDFSFLLISPLLAYYTFNRFPSRLHLGEVGGASIGLTLIYLATLTFNQAFNVNDSVFESLIIAVFPISFLLIEVGVSTLRRLMKGKSPFVSDQFHIHHLFKNYYGMSVNQSSNVLMCYQIFTVLGGLILILRFQKSPLIVFSAITLMSLFNYFMLGYQAWFDRSDKGKLVQNFIGTLKREKILLIDSSISESFEIKITSTDDEVEQGQEAS